MITFKAFLAEKALNASAYEKAMERLGDAKFGFELEMWVPKTSNYYNASDDEYDRHTNWNDTAEGIAADLGDDLGVRMHVEKNVEDKPNMNHWRIVKDGSIDDYDGDGKGFGVEIVSPPQNVADGFDDLRTCFNFMSQAGFVTNESTGLHINLSIPGLKDKLDPLKLVLFMGEDHLLKKYDREMNAYTKTHTRDLTMMIKSSGQLPKSAKGLSNLALKALRNEKYRTVNLSKLDAGYLEFRTAGNANYHKKFKQVQDDVGRFLTVLELACDRDAERQEYLKKLAKLFSASKATVNHSMDKDAKGLRAIIGDDHLFRLKNRADSDKPNEKATVELLGSIMSVGSDLSRKNITLDPKVIAEFKVLLVKIKKQIPDILSLTRATMRSQVELDSMKDFMKAFNIK